jgi:hypothetical protein
MTSLASQESAAFKVKKKINSINSSRLNFESGNCRTIQFELREKKNS